MPEQCPDHNAVQHRDGCEPWCNFCGLTSDYRLPFARLMKHMPAPEDCLESVHRPEHSEKVEEVMNDRRLRYECLLLALDMRDSRTATQTIELASSYEAYVKGERL